MDRKPRISLIYKNETGATGREAREADGRSGGDRRDSARIAAGANGSKPRPRLREMRQRRRAPDVGVDGELPRRAHATVQFARRDGAPGAPMAFGTLAAGGVGGSGVSR